MPEPGFSKIYRKLNYPSATLKLTTTMKRRKFIIFSAISAAAVSLPFMSCSRPDPELDKKLALPEILAQTYDEKTIREIGNAYGKIHPDEYNISELEQLLKKDTDGKVISSSLETSELNSILEKRVKNDFNTGQTIIIDGLILSLTEARQCALYTLIPQN